jgi:hypothetical protein
VEHSKAFNMTILTQDRSDQLIQGWECYKSIQRVKVECSFLMDCEKASFPEEYEMVDTKQCWHMVRNNALINGTKLNEISDGYLGTNVLDEPEEKWWRENNMYRVNFYAIRHVMSIDDVDMTIQTYASTKGSCLAKSGNCETEKGILVWDQYNITSRSCRLDIVKTTPCILSGNQVSCPDINMALTGLTTIETCGMFLGYSDQRVMFVLDKSDKLGNGLRITKLEHVKNILKEYGRIKRTIDDQLITSSELAYKLQFVHNLIAGGVNGLLQSLHLNICHLSRFAYDSLVNQALSNKDGDITVYAQTMLSDRNVRANLKGDVISIWRCEKIK